MTGSAGHLLALYGPLAVIGFVAAVLRAWSLRAADPKRKRLFNAAWILLILVGGPIWIFLAATLGL